MSKDTHGDAPGGSLDSFLVTLAKRRPSLIDLGLTRVRNVLERLDRPQERVPPTFHIAGTNGKGSTGAYLRAILSAAGARVHVFTSPHLVRYNERINLAGEEISDDFFLDVLTRVDCAAGDDELTFFETITCAAFLAFAEVAADYLILEVGLGGRLDATNVIAAPLCSVITPIALDHQKFLGDTLSKIASEKAGIFKAHRPGVIGVQEPEAMATLLSCAEDIGATPHAYGMDWTFWPDNGRIAYQDERGLSDLSPPKLFGRHQIANAALAVAATKAAGVQLGDETLSRGIEAAFWPGRFQRLKSGPIIDRLASQGSACEVWLDGGHNPHAAAALAAAVGELEERAPMPLIMVAGMQSNKDATGFFAPFEGLVRDVIAISSEHKLALPPEEVAAAARSAGLRATPAVSMDDAIDTAVKCVDGPARILIAGSLYLAGDVLRAGNR